jgi:hypothetical protein
MNSRFGPPRLPIAPPVTEGKPSLSIGSRIYPAPDPFLPFVVVLSYGKQKDAIEREFQISTIGENEKRLAITSRAF